MGLKEQITELSRPKRTIEESYRYLEQQGCRLIEAQENHYVMEGPAGRFLTLNASITDEVFASKLGILNVTIAWQNIARVVGKETPKELSTDTLFLHARNIDLEEDAIRRMTPKRRNLPVLMVVSNGSGHLIDGAHRVYARKKHGLKTTKAYVLGDETIPLMRVQTFQLHPDGSRTDVTATTPFAAQWLNQPQ